MTELIDFRRHNDLINKVIDYLNKELPEAQQGLVGKYTRYYYANVDYEDLQQYSVMDLAGAALSHWNFSFQRVEREAKIRVYNPSYEKDGWQSTHTIVEISHDDMPFLVDTARMEIIRQGIGIHLMIHPGCLQVKRDAQNCIINLTAWHENHSDASSEAPIHIKIDRITDETLLSNLCLGLNTVLSDVRYAVNDWQSMLTCLNNSIEELQRHPPESNDTSEIEETKAFLLWLKNNNFTFIGCRDYELIGEGNKKALRIIPDSRLGVHRGSSVSKVYRSLAEMPQAVRTLMLSPQVLIIAKTNTKSTIHRSAYTDYIGIKRFNAQGQLIGERRFIGLYTSSAYNSNPKDIPFLRHKVATVIKNSGLLPCGHAGKDLLNILETFPRDDLFQADTDELTRLALGILNLQERKCVRLFVRHDIYSRYVSCLVYLPRELFNTQLQNKMQRILERAFNGVETEQSIRFSKSVLARLHFLVRIEYDNSIPDYDLAAIQQKLVDASRLWSDDLQDLLSEFYDEEKAIILFRKYGRAFPAAYRDEFTARAAIADITYIEKLSSDNPLEMNIYLPFGIAKNKFHFKLFRAEYTIPLSDVMPIFDNMGLRVLEERSYKISREDGVYIWINDFDMYFNEQLEINLDLIKNNLLEAFAKIWFARAENDGFNQLILTAQLTWREVSILRALAKYLQQINFNLSQNYIEQTLNRYAFLTCEVINLFNQRFNPALNISERSSEKFDLLLGKFEAKLDRVEYLDEDRIFRVYMALIQAILRTNYFQEGKKSYITFKLAPKLILNIPLPCPMYEIFVYSPDFEGVHLRSGKVARGGLRWSDRREDFRTEVLSLMKAQQVKNAVIVPSGAKGGFFPKQIPIDKDRTAIMNNTIACYKNFIRGMLDVTDNLVNGCVVPPRDVLRYDEDDTYLVVAADKGTATFSDIANEITKEYNFWLGDAFASGGSFGYDHKKMGITARGAWESVNRHFRSLGKDIQQEDFTVIGIGDMSGDVFGNGMLLSEHICLVGAFNHQHIFLDPNPNAQVSFKERQRLFNLPRSSWIDYNVELISKGGGVFSRFEKSISLTPEIQQLLNLEQDTIIPSQLISALLRAKVDLLWNGGIGTYVKASDETNIEVGDKTNDELRIDADELSCKVIVEGGNLGLTQLARIEFSLNNGYMYTDFIDNSAGVDCSDHEVNLKILLHDFMAHYELSELQRNRLLKKFTEEVSQLVLSNNYHQTLSIELSLLEVQRRPDVYRRHISYLEEQCLLDRKLEYLPNDKQLTARWAAGFTLTRPELAVLMSYSKILLKQQILASNLPEDEYFIKHLYSAFPSQLGTRFRTVMKQHRLRRDIIATQLSKDIVNHMGGIFIYRMIDETGKSVSDIIRAYVVASSIFNLNVLWQSIKALNVKIDSRDELNFLFSLNRLVRRATRWVLRNRQEYNITKAVEWFAGNIRHFYGYLHDVLSDVYQQRLSHYVTIYEQKNIASPLAFELAAIKFMYSSLDIIEAAKIEGYEVRTVAEYYFIIGQEFQLDWLREQLQQQQKPESKWDALALSTFYDDLDYLQRMLAVSVLKFETDHQHPANHIRNWIESYEHLVKRWNVLMTSIRASGAISMVVLFVGLRELTDLARNANNEATKIVSK